MFRVGQKVVYVDDAETGDLRIWPGKVTPELNAVYTIREIHWWEGACGFLLEEITNPVSDVFEAEPGFLARRFRPVVERKTSIEIFQRMLSPVRSPEYLP